MNNIVNSVKSLHPWQSVVQTSYDIVKAHGGVPIAIGIKVETKEARPPARAGTDGDDPVGQGEGSDFIITLPIA